MDTRNKNVQWDTITRQNYYQSDQHYNRAILATLMDIRDELQTLNRVFACTNFQNIPHVLKRISANTHEAKKARKQS